MSRRPSGARPDINVTPLVDVVLVLLIIFMVVTPQMESGAAVDLPAVRNPDPQHKSMKPITVSVTKAGEVWLEKERVPDDGQLVSRLNALHEEERSRKLQLKGDRAARYDDVRRVFRICQEVGFPGISLQVGDRKGEKDKENRE